MPTIDMSECLCCEPCCLGECCNCIQVTPTDIPDGTCNCRDLLEYDCSVYGVYILHGNSVNNPCVWGSCCDARACVEIYQALECLPTQIVHSIMTMDRAGAIVLEFFLHLSGSGAECTGAWLIARYEGSSPSRDLCTPVTLNRTYNDGTCTFPSTMTIVGVTDGPTECWC
jgi:hypothetical protein